jgi:hypothetical protein
MVVASILVVLAAAAVSPAQAGIVLQVTEIWAGQDGSDLTKDWFELTNVGDMPWIAASGPVLTVNDNGGGLGTDDLVEGIADILPGESVIILMEGTAPDAQTFFDVWNPVKPQVLANIGYADGVPSGGLGLSSSGDGVRVWLDDVLQDSEDYTSPPSGVSWDAELGEYSTIGNSAGAVATIALNDAGEPAVGSPGMIPVPEPSSIALLAIAALAAAWTIRR